MTMTMAWTSGDLLDDRGATFNRERTHRQRLWRIWSSQEPKLVAIGMNPSKADEHDNDPTVERVVRRAMRLGYGGVIMLNMQDVIETDSLKLDSMPAEQRCTGANIQHLSDGLDMAAAGQADVLCAWGRPGHRYGPVAWFTTGAARRQVTLFCLGMNADGSPKHPLYIPYEKSLEWFGGVDRVDASLPIFR